jgi:3-oxoacyl-(acyl-carrier-protein) reductase
MNFKPLKGKVCLVTGGSRGIGRATAITLADQGASIAINYSSAESAAQEVCDAITEKNGVAKIYKANVSDETEARAMVAQAEKDLGPIQILVNNAGITRDKSFLKMSKDMWDEVLGVNLNGPFNVSHAVLPSMIKTGWGRIINVTSIVGQTGSFGQANYAVTKGGLISFTMTLAREVARKGITVNAVAPGYIDTDMTKDVPTAVLDQVRTMTPLGRLGHPEEVAAAISFLSSPQASYITGQILPVNGGMYM